MYAFLDIVLLLVHGSLVIFNLIGWIWKKTRRAHLWTILLTLASWSLLGIFFGFGYCPLTDWQWDVKRKLGETGLPNSFIEYYLDRITPFDWESGTVDALVLGLTLTALAAALLVNLHDWRKRKRASSV